MKNSSIVIATPHGTLTFDPEAERGTTRSARLQEVYSLAIELLKTNDVEACVGILRKLALIRPDDPDILTFLCGALAGSGGLQEATRVLRDVRARFPRDAKALATLGALLTLSADFAGAEEVLEESLALDGNGLGALVNLAVCLLIQGKHANRAESLLRRAQRLLPDSQSMCANLGEALRQQGKLAEADQQFLRGIELAPGTERANDLRQARALLALSGPGTDPSLN